jgi:hypothetical protein
VGSYYQPFHGKPDAITFWAKFSGTGPASVSAIIHQGGTMQDPGGNYSNIVGWAANSIAAPSSWQQFTVPFRYGPPYTATIPEYILISFSTNQTPGSGSNNDKFWIDDVSFVYNVNVSSIKVNGADIQDFNPSITEYSINVPCGTTINLTALSQSENATITIENPSAANNFTGTIMITHGDLSKTIIVHANPVGQTINILDTICQGQPYIRNGFELAAFNEAGIFTDAISVPSGNNCFNQNNLTLTVNPSYNFVQNAQTCAGVAYDFFGEQITEPGPYTKNFTTVYGCDSIYKLNLSVGNRIEMPPIIAAICEGETYTDHGFAENTTGFYEKVYTKEGCDSVVFLDLTVGQKYTININATICEGTYYAENGFYKNTAGDYTINPKTKLGCDSIINLHLTVDMNTELELYDTIECRKFYEQNGFAIFKTDTLGDFEYFLFDTLNCQKKTLFLHIKEPYRPPIVTNPDFTFKVFPNPATTYFRIQIDYYEAGDIQYFLYNLNGLLVRTGMVTSDNFIVNTQNINSGIYILKLFLNKESWKEHRIFIKYSIEWND